MTLYSVLAWFCFLSAFITCALGFFVYSKDTRSRINQLFLVCMLGATYWATGEFFFWHSMTYDEALFWLRASALWPLAIAATTHFILEFTEYPFARNTKSALLLICLYLPAAAITVLGIFTGALYSVVYQEGIGFVYHAEVTSPIYPLVAIFSVIIVIWAVLACSAAWNRAESEKRRHHVHLVSGAILFPIGFGAVSGIIFPALGIPLPNLVFIGIALYAATIAYAISHVGLFQLNTETALPYILRTMPDGVIITGMDGRIISANASAARIFRAEENSLAGKNASAIIPEPAYGTFMRAIQENGWFADHEAVLSPEVQRPDDRFFVSIAGSLVQEPGEPPAGVVLIVRDISSRKRQQHALQMAGEKISLIARLTSHDINNLVTGLSGYLLLLEDAVKNPPEDGYLRTATELSDRISQNLRFSSDFLHLGTYEPGWQSLVGLVAEAENSISHKSISVTVKVPPVEIYTDPLSVKAFYNILENALHHGENISTISIFAQEDSNHELVVVIGDDGKGVPDADKERIFQYGVGKHTGLGLSFARTILEVTGITIIENGTFGKGARFEIRVPAGAWRPAQQPVWGLPEEPDQAGAGKEREDPSL
ncbi:ATP-binding protein [Methanoregula sp.]|uniref:ATP-binding protein n=1 Tax=Methanoregula sp. TaxID=2052170 RepID=UPI00260633E7|nr:ATP-binding protein [Methanoregula sp.]MDD5143981.1 histidine kinase N-terminal 7TM domain-containing protein [Methanoregula sp.]